MNIKTVDLNESFGSNKKLYLIYDEKRQEAKIGLSTNPNERMNQLSVARPNSLEIIKTWSVKEPFKIEKKIHNRLIEYSSGGEWFNLDPSTVHNIKNAIDIFISNTDNDNEAETA